MFIRGEPKWQIKILQSGEFMPGTKVKPVLCLSRRMSLPLVGMRWVPAGRAQYAAGVTVPNARKLGALLPSLLDRAFKGEL
jgi:hypothetical protein